MQQVNFINNHKFNKIYIDFVSLLSCYYVPFFRSCNYNLCLFDFILVHFNITCQFPDSNSKVSEPGLKVSNNFAYQSFHWSDINNFELFKLESTLGSSELRQNVKNC